MPATRPARRSRKSAFRAGLAVGDLFNDGNMDVVISDIDGAPMILKNRGVPGRHWVSFELAGTKSNRLALNARIKIVAGGMTQTEEIHSGGSYLSQNDLRVHFGLGAAKKIDSVEIRWLSGKMETLRRPGAGSVLCGARRAGSSARRKDTTRAREASLSILARC